MFQSNIRQMLALFNRLLHRDSDYRISDGKKRYIIMMPRILLTHPCHHCHHLTTSAIHSQKVCSIYILRFSTASSTSPNMWLGEGNSLMCYINPGGMVRTETYLRSQSGNRPLVDQSSPIKNLCSTGLL